MKFLKAFFLVVCNKSFWINFSVKAAQINDRKLVRIALIRNNLRSLRSSISARFHARNCLKNFCYKSLITLLFFVHLSCHSEGIAHGDRFNEEQLQLLATEKKLEKFNEQMKWLASYFDSFLSENKDRFKKNGTWEKQLQNNEEIKQKAKCVQEQFLNFRQAVSDLIYLVNDSSPYASTLSMSTYLELTRWYIESLTHSLFPKGWEDLYEDYLKKEEKSILPTSVRQSDLAPEKS